MEHTQITPAGTEPNLILATRVLKTPVYTSDGSHVGHLDDLSIDRGSGHCIYGIVSSGGLLHIGEKLNPIPWDVLQYDTFAEGFVLPITRQELESAPHYTRKELTELGGPRHKGRDPEISKFYAGFGLFH